MKKKAFLFIGLITMLFVMLASCSTNKTIKISFDAQGGSKCQTVTIDDETESIDLPDTTKENYIFKGWFFDKELTKQVPDPLTKDQFPTESTTFYARWDEIYYTITFRVGNTTLKEKTCYLNDQITAADYPDLTAYPDYHWEYEAFSVSRNRVILATKNASGEETEIFSVEYVVSGERYAFYSGEEGATIATPSNPVATGDAYFAGWSLRENGEVVSSLPTKISSSNVRYYAQFRSVPDSTNYLVYREVTEGGVTSVVITGLTTEGMYQKEIGIPARIGGKNVTAIGYADSGNRKISDLRVFKSTALTTVYLPVGLRTIGAWAFSDCTALNRVVSRSNDLSYIGRGAFAGCVSLTSFSLTDHVTVVDDYAFAGLTSKKTSEKIGKEIKDSLPALWQAETLYETDMALSSFTAGSASVLSEIGSYGFFRCKSLQSLLLPSVMTGINYLSFAESGLADIRVYAGGNFNAVDGAVYSANGRILYYYPLCGRDTFAVPAGVTQISDNAFRGNKNLVSVSFSDSVTTIGRDSFRGCENLTNVLFEEDSLLTTVLSGAFADCDDIVTVNFPKKLVNFSDRVFENDLSLVRVTFSGKDVTAIGDYAFCGCLSLEGIALPEKTSTIGQYAFYGCTSLYEFGLNVNETALAYIGDYAFCDCSELTSVYLPDTLKFIGDYAFCGLTKKMKLELSSNDFASLECLGERAFCNTSIMEFTLRSKLVSASIALSRYGKNYTLGAYAFADCASLKNFSFSPVTVYSEVPEGFLYGCTALTGLSFTYNVESIGDYALYGCTALKTVNFNARVEDARQMITSIGAYAFAGCRSLTGGVGVAKLLPTSLTSVGEGAFSGCTSITSISVPKDLQVISKNAFSGCTALLNVTYDDPMQTTLHTLEENCFAGCTSLGRDHALALPVSLGLKTAGKGFVKNPFFGCTSLSAFSFPNDNENGLYTEGGVIYYQNKPTRDGSDLYAFPTAKMGGPVEIPSSVSLIEDYAFYGATLTKLTFIDNASVDNTVKMILVTIGEYAFAESGLTEVTLSSRVQTVGAHAFENCRLASLEISRDYYRNGDKIGNIGYETAPAADNSITIGDYAFYHTTLTSVVVSHRVTSIGIGAFASCYSLSDIDFTDTVAGLDNTLSLGDSVFENDTALQQVSLPGRLVLLGENAFKDCYNVENVFFTEGARGLTLGGHALSGIHFLYEITLPANIVSMGSGVFADDTRLKYFYFPDSLSVADTLTIPEEAFLGDNKLDVLTVPGYVTEIGKKAYYGTRLYEVEFESGLNCLSIGDYAFAEAVNLTTVILPDNCVFVGSHAFYNSKKLIDVEYSGAHYGKTVLGNTDYTVGATITRDVYVKNFHRATGDYRYAEEYYVMTLLTGYVLDSQIEGEVFVWDSGVFGYVPTSGTYQMNVEYYTADLMVAPAIGTTCAADAYVCRYALNLGSHYAQGVKYHTFTETALTGSVDESYYVLFDGQFVTYYEMEIGDHAFSGTALARAEISGRVRSMGESVFADIGTLTGANVDGKFSALPAGTFKNDKALIDVSLGGRIKAVGAYAFYNSGVVRVSNGTVPSYTTDAVLIVDEIDEYAFSGAALTSIVVSNDGALDIRGHAFESCVSLSAAYVVSGGALTCEEFSFGNCVSLEHFTLNASVLTVGKGFAYNAVKLEDFNVRETSVDRNYYLKDHVLYNYAETDLVFYPAGKTGSFVELSSSVRSIGDYAFYGNGYLTGILIYSVGNSVVALGENSMAEMGNVVIYVASNLVSLYKNEWGVSGVQPYSTNLNGFVLTIQNSGMYYVSAYLGTDVDLVVPGSMTGGGSYYEITGVAKDAFRNNKTLRSVVLAPGIKTVSNGAFRGCTALERVEIGENVTGIKNYAFYGCGSLRDIVFSGDSSVVSIGNYAFSGCKALESVTLPARLETVGSYAFAGDEKLVSVTFFEGLQEVKNNAFENCDALTSVVFPSTVTTLGSYLFRGCGNIIYIRCLAEEVPAIEDKTFVEVPDDIFFFVPGKSLNAYNVDSKWRNHIEKVLSADYIYDAAGTTEFKNYVLEPIENNEYRLVAYIGNESDVKIKTEVENNVIVTAIGENAFASFVETIEIGIGVTTIDANAFTYAVNLRSVVLPSSVVSIGSYAFADLDYLASVTVSGVIYVSADTQAMTYYGRGEWEDQYTSFYVYSGGEYLPATNVYSSVNKYFFLREDYSLTTIGDHAFYNCTALTEFAVPYSVRTIGRYAFSCANDRQMNLRTVTFAHDDILGTEGVTVRIEDYAFANNKELLSLVFNCYLEYLGEGAFCGCSTMTGLQLNYEPTKASDYLVTEVPTGARKIFENCDKLTVVVPSTNDLKRYQDKWGTGSNSYNVITSAINKLIAKEYVVDDFSYSIVDPNKKTVTTMGYLGSATTVTFPSTITLRGAIYNVVRIGR
ncbi:MAG: leucine-rich repeat protein, partial [Clostridia bacterium]|nr:leucine-rich repeat protein [Clostridia bacterium]